MLLLYHIILLFGTTYLLAKCIPLMILFLSSQGYLGWYDYHFPYDAKVLRAKNFTVWTDGEVRYVLTHLLSDIMLVAVFILQHSLMATVLWKQFLHKLHFRTTQRLLYVLATSVALMKLMDYWISIPEVGLWEIDTGKSFLLRLFFFLLHGACWSLLLLQCSLMDPLELMGLGQVHNYYRGLRPPINYKSLYLQTFYSHLRHAGPTCLGIILWVHPVMTLDRLLLALLFMLYFSCCYHQVTEADYIFAKSYFVIKGSRTTTYYEVETKQKQ